jgi:hypothetical protein
MTTVKTKKTQLQPNTFIKIGLEIIAREYWWVWFIPLSIMVLPLIWKGLFWWCLVGSLLLIVLYWAFWAVQFTGITQLEQFKPLFQKLYYEIDSRQFMFKVNEKEGGFFKWDQIKEIRKSSDYYLVMLSKFQFIHLPFNVFKTEQDQRFFESIVAKKGILKKYKSLKIRNLIKKPA